jgi:hypothetical protein
LCDDDISIAIEFYIEYVLNNISSDVGRIVSREYTCLVHMFKEMKQPGAAENYMTRHFIVSTFLL